MQRGLWMSQRLPPDAPVQNMALLTHIDGSVDVDRLATAFDRVVDEVDVLRTRFTEAPGTPPVRPDATPPTPTPPPSAPGAATARPPCQAEAARHKTSREAGKTPVHRNTF